MTALQKLLVFAGAAALLGLAAMVNPFNRPSPQVAAAASGPAASRLSAAVSSPPAARPPESGPAAGAAPVPADPIPPLPADAASVPDSDLLKLIGMVDLANARYQPPDKARWAAAIPAAQRLLQGPCDCEQRNWLNRFVEMGGHALSDSPAQYHDYAEMMVTLGRNDADAMARRRQQANN